MNEPIQLTLEQQFNLRSFESQVNQMSHQQAQAFLVNLYKQMIYREELYKKMIRHEWNIDVNKEINK
jgi:hypothetical protein